MTNKSADAAASGGTTKKRSSANSQSSRMTLLAHHWNSLSTDAKSAWNFANAQMQDPANPNNNGVKGPTGWTAFFACNSALMTANQPMTHTAPSAYTPPAALPPLHVNIVFVGATPVMTLTPDMAVPAGAKLVVWATKAVPNGNATFKPRAYFKIGVLTGGIPLAGVGIGPQYLSEFPTPPSSAKIGFKVMAVSAGGFHSNTVETFGITPALSLSADASGPEPGAENENAQRAA